MPAQAAVTSQPLPIVVFGLDDQGKGHASRFDPADAALAERAAGLMGMRVLRLASPEEIALAAELPAGRVFASGKAFVPFVAKGRFERLSASPNAFVPDRPTDVPAPAPRSPAKGRKTSAGAGTPTPASDAADEALRPAGDWPSIGAGSLVLAAEEGIPAIWHAAIVIADRREDILELRWWDDDGSVIVRRREHLGLFPAAVVEALA